MVEPNKLTLIVKDIECNIITKYYHKDIIKSTPIIEGDKVGVISAVKTLASLGPHYPLHLLRHLT